MWIAITIDNKLTVSTALALVTVHLQEKVYNHVLIKNC